MDVSIEGTFQSTVELGHLLLDVLLRFQEVGLQLSPKISQKHILELIKTVLKLFNLGSLFSYFCMCI